MAITAGEPPKGDGMTSHTNPPFKHEEQKHTGQALPPEPSAHPLNDGQIMDMLDDH